MPDVTSGWGRLTWDQSQWGGSTLVTTGFGAEDWNNGSWGQINDEIVFPTGVSASFSIGDAVAYSAQGWGRDGWSDEPWGESFDPVISVEGFGLTASLGDAEEFNETGWGRLSWNQADWNEAADETVSVSGLEATSSIGSITPAFTYLLEMIGANHSMTTSIGSPQVDGEIGVPLTGVSAEFATPTMSYVGTLVGWGRDSWNDNSWGESPNQVITLVGREATASVGSPTLQFAYELTGVAATSNVGSFSFVISPVVRSQGGQGGAWGYCSPYPIAPLAEAAGPANSGWGGGGGQTGNVPQTSWNGTTGGAGGSGVVIIRYKYQ